MRGCGGGAPGAGVGSAVGGHSVLRETHRHLVTKRAIDEGARVRAAGALAAAAVGYYRILLPALLPR